MAQIGRRRTPFEQKGIAAGQVDLQQIHRCETAIVPQHVSAVQQLQRAGGIQTRPQQSRQCLHGAAALRLRPAPCAHAVAQQDEERRPRSMEAGAPVAGEGLPPLANCPGSDLRRVLRFPFHAAQPGICCALQIAGQQ